MSEKNDGVFGLTKFDNFEKSWKDRFGVRLENFLNELKTAAEKEFPGHRKTRKRLVSVSNVLGGAERIIREKQEVLREILRSMVGFELEEKNDPPKTGTLEPEEKSFCKRSESCDSNHQTPVACGTWPDSNVPVTDAD